MDWSGTVGSQRAVTDWKFACICELFVAGCLVRARPPTPVAEPWQEVFVHPVPPAVSRIG
jgi:hypothetical protein